MCKCANGSYTCHLTHNTSAQRIIDGNATDVPTWSTLTGDRADTARLASPTMRN
ncbi:hypothetical protein ACFFMN_23255 [Planobispora siamensis]|uniref:Uncharacterized protein n=1 Tax=Planobispora siamensis TaxID=936338 RepID=A0A8J3SLD0_9ACTN|nr:hypothetical protein [Planobispora siamensis]GIH95280.1 hypothetical protein Psi01_59100 [Planobispora siamensis]